MRPFTLARTGVGFTDFQLTNYLQPNFKLGFGVRATGTVTYSVQHTMDNPQDFTSTADFQANALWFNNADVSAIVDTSQDGNYFFPIRAIRINVTAGTGTVDGTFIQGGED